MSKRFTQPGYVGSLQIETFLCLPFYYYSDAIVLIQKPKSSSGCNVCPLSGILSAPLIRLLGGKCGGDVVTGNSSIASPWMGVEQDSDFKMAHISKSFSFMGLIQMEFQRQNRKCSVSVLKQNVANKRVKRIHPTVGNSMKTLYWVRA